MNKNINYKNIIMKSTNLKKACINCKIYNLSGQQSGPLIERYIIKHYNLLKELSSDCVGDCSKNNKFIEIKVSLGGVNHNKFNYVQLRMNHEINIYLLIAYYLNNDNLTNNGELFIFNIKKEKMIDIIYKYGNYAHGTIKKNGYITMKDLIEKNNNNEYSIRPKYNDKCWQELLLYRVTVINI